jgi:hypothetical protein
MSLLVRMNKEEPSETWPVLHRAAEERFWDGMELGTGHWERLTGAIYLFGYVAEITLKVAIFRARKWSDKKPVDLDWFKNYAKHMCYSLHDIAGLANLLIDQRKSSNPLDPVFAAELSHNAKIISANWRETLRYRSIAAQYAELSEVFQSIEWLRSNERRLWR